MRKVGWLWKIVIPIVAVIVLLLPAIPAFAGTTADVTVTATGSFVSFTSNVSSYAFGTIAASSTTNTSGTYIGFTNTSSVSTNWSVKILAATWTSVGSGWTHGDTGIPGVNTVAMEANSSNATTWASNVSVKASATFNNIATSVAAGSAVLTGLSLLAPTSFTDGSSNNNTVRFTAVAS